jgi:hypothetical protein
VIGKGSRQRVARGLRIARGFRRTRGSRMEFGGSHAEERLNPEEAGCPHAAKELNPEGDGGFSPRRRTQTRVASRPGPSYLALFRRMRQRSPTRAARMLYIDVGNGRAA